MLPALFGIASALSWGAGDFIGGLASRKTGAYRTIFYAEIVGIVIIVTSALEVGQAYPSLRSCLLAVTAGVIATTGLLLLYQSMTLGLMSIAVPVSALLAAIIPVAVGVFTAGLPKPTTIAGFGFALLAIWFVSQSGDGITDILAHIADLKLPLLAGIGFGLYFVIMHNATRESTLWPMVVSRSGGMTIIAVYMLIRRDSWKVEKTAWQLVILNGILDSGGNFFYIVASQLGRMDISALLSSLYPAATVLLAALILKERLTPRQSTGILLALIAIVLITI